MEQKYYNNAVNSIYPFVNSYTNKDVKVSPKELALILKSLKNLEAVYLQNTDTKYHENFKSIFHELRLFVKKIFEVARKRNEIDIKLVFNDASTDLAEIIMFTSAVNLGIFLNVFGIVSKEILIAGGILGLLLHFSGAIYKFIKNTYLNLTRVNMVGDNVFYEYRDVKKTRKDVEEESEMLNKILLKGNEKNSDFKRIIDIILYYKNKIYDEDMFLLKESDCNRDVVFETESIVDTVVSVLIVALVSVENRNPLPGDKKFFGFVFNLLKIAQIIGYILLNTLSFNLLTNYFSNAPYLLLVINISSGIVVSLSLYLIQKVLRQTLYNKIHEVS